MNESNNETNQGIISDNNGFQAGTALQIRLDTEPVIRRIEMYLRGYEEKIDTDEAGLPVLRVVKTGEMKAGEEGIQAIMGRVQTIFNPQVVQGNFDDKRCGEYLCRVRGDICTDLMVNLHRYKINMGDYNSIVNMIMSGVEPFISRLINNKERESYNNTVHSRESNISHTRGGGYYASFYGKIKL